MNEDYNRVTVQPIRLLMRKSSFFFILLFVFRSVTSLHAHPHVFIDTTVTAVFDDAGITGFQIQWLFDEMFSSMIMNDFDENNDVRFSSHEIENIEENAFSNLKNFHYFSYIKADGKEYPIDKVVDFSASLINERLIYSFFIPCRIGAQNSETVVTLSVYDETYYCDVAFDKETPILFKNADSFVYHYEIVEDSKNPYYYGQVFPQEIVLRFRKKDG